MAKFERTPDYRVMYPEASDEVIDCLRKGHRKMQYAEYDLKTEQCKIDMEAGTVIFTQSREDSLDRLMGEDIQFRDESESVEDEAVKLAMLDKLRKCLPMLSEGETALITALFFEELSERQYFERTGIPQKTVNDRRHRTLAKLKKLMESKK